MKKKINSLRNAKKLQLSNAVDQKRLVPKEGKKPTDSIKDLAVLHRKTKHIGEAEVTLT